MSLAQFSIAASAIRHVCRVFAVTPTQLEAHDRSVPLIYYRWFAIELCCSKAGLSNVAAGLLFDRCPSAILVARRSLRDLLATNRSWREQYETLRDEFGSLTHRSLPAL